MVAWRLAVANPDSAAVTLTKEEEGRASGFVAVAWSSWLTPGPRRQLRGDVLLQVQRVQFLEMRGAISDLLDLGDEPASGGASGPDNCRQLIISLSASQGELLIRRLGLPANLEPRSPMRALRSTLPQAKLCRGDALLELAPPSAVSAVNISRHRRSEDARAPTSGALLGRSTR